MTDWRSVLNDSRGEESMSAARAQEIRRAAIAEAQAASRSRSGWPWQLAVAALTLAVLAGGHRGRLTTTGDRGAAGSVESPSDERRQVQFATPGGTRIIWELNPRFTLMETLP